ncbi:response regulator [Thermodesulfobacteriota bacterium]
MKKILVVDNDRITLGIVTRLLEKEGHQVLTSRDGLGALDILKTYTPDIIFVDLIMPNVDGKALCRTVRSIERLKDVYLVILSAVAAEKEIDIKPLGVNACIAKGPFDGMTRHILSVLDQPVLDSSQILSEKVFGVESIHPRGITVELLSAKRHFEIILDRMTEGILEINSEGRVVYVNPFALSLIDIPENELLGSHFSEMFSGDTHQRVSDLLKLNAGESRSITDDAPVNLNEYQLTLDVLPLDENGFSSIVILNDVSERKRMESQLRQAHRMEAIGTLAGGIAHDFNNLLMGIQGRVSLMLMDTNTSHPYFEHLKGIEEHVKSAADLNKQLLGFARGGRYEVKPADLNELSKKCSRMFARTKKEIVIRERYDENLWTAEVDQSQIEQVLLNFFVNAWQSMPGGGDIFIQTENVVIEESYARQYQVEPGKYVKISVIDTGVGIDGATQQRIFDPFFTTKEMGRGTGLGLASAYGIVKNHGGFIEVYSEVDEGATFSIVLPASEKAVVKEENHHEEVLKGTETVLLVDDEDLIIEIGQQILETLGYQVLLARGGKEAIDVYTENRDEIDLVILDMVMPDMGGGDTFDNLKKINPDLKVLLSSGYSVNGQATEILARGCNGFIQKPFDLNSLSKRMREILNKRNS